MQTSTAHCARWRRPSRRRFSGNGNSPPTVRILQPADGATFCPNDLITLVGSVEDREDETIEYDRLRWDVRLGHNAHSHPIAVLEGCEPTFRAGLGGHGADSDLYYVVELAYTDNRAPGAGPLTGRAQIRLVAEP